MASLFLQLLLFLSLPLPLSLCSGLSASQSLRLRTGYSLSSSSLSLSLSSPSWNRSGTFLAPPDSSFSLYPHRKQPSLSLLLSHTLLPRLSSLSLSSLSPHPLPTWLPNRCLNPIPTVKILHPDIYLDDHLAVHGIDRFITDDLTVQCPRPNPTAEIKSHLLDHSVNVLRRKGFGVVAAGLNIKKTDLLKLDDVTVFATSDETLFSEANGFRYDFLRHVAPRRYRLEEIRRLRSIETMERTTVAVGSESSSGYFEIYRNRWIVVIGMPRGFDDRDLPVSGGGGGGGVYGEEDNLFCAVREREREMVESAPSREINREGESEPLDGRVLGESTVEIVRRKMSSEEGPKIVQFQVADDLFYYT